MATPCPPSSGEGPRTTARRRKDEGNHGDGQEENGKQLEGDTQTSRPGWLPSTTGCVYEPGQYEGKAGKERRREDLEELFLAAGAYRDTAYGLYEAASKAMGTRRTLSGMSLDVIRAEMGADRQKEGN